MAFSLLLYSLYLLLSEFYLFKLNIYPLAMAFPVSLGIGHLLFGGKAGLERVDILKFSIVLAISVSLLLVIL